MAGRRKQEARGSVNSARFAALLDKLVGVDVDLEPICRVGLEALPVVAAADAIADACDVLRSAIADLRNIIHQVDGLAYLPSEGALALARVEQDVRRP